MTFSSFTPSTCTVAGYAVSLVAVGPCTVAADQAAIAGYTAAPQATQSFAVTAASLAVGIVVLPGSQRFPIRL